MHLKAIDQLVESVDQVIELCEGMKQDYDFVQLKSSALQNDCERLMEEQRSLVRTSDEIAEKLSYFTELEKITKLFNSPGSEVCTNEFFIPMLTRLDECVDFLETNVNILLDYIHEY